MFLLWTKWAFLESICELHTSATIKKAFGASSPVGIGRHALNQSLVVIDLSLQLHLHAQQIVVGFNMALHLRPHLTEPGLQVQDGLVEGGQTLTVLHFGACEGFLQIADLKGRNSVMFFWGVSLFFRMFLFG